MSRDIPFRYVDSYVALFVYGDCFFGMKRGALVSDYQSVNTYHEFQYHQILCSS